MKLSIDDDPNSDGYNSFYVPDRHRAPLTFVVREIIGQSGGYGNYVATLPLGVKPHRIPADEFYERSWCLGYLADNKIITYNEEDYETISVVNRYNLEIIHLLLEGKQNEIAKLPNLAYYQPSTGRGFVNGNAVRLKGINKRLFDELFLACPEPVDRELLKKTVRARRRKSEIIAYDVGQAMSNLRKACKVNATVIELHDSGRLNAKIFNLDAQFFG